MPDNNADTDDTPLLKVADLAVQIGHPPVKAVQGISFSLARSEILGLAGESGSGKSVTALALSRLIPPAARPAYQGTVRLKGTGHNLLRSPPRLLRQLRRQRLRYIFQEPSASFHPLFTIGNQLIEAIRISTGLRGQAARNRAAEALAEVGIEPTKTIFKAFPAMFSGGMLQRLAIATAICSQPDLLIADEPTTALDTTTQKRIIDLLQNLNQRHHMAILFISHDLGLLHQICHRLLVMQSGHLVESGSAATVLHHPSHPYTRSLVKAIPRLRLPESSLNRDPLNHIPSQNTDAPD